MPKGVTVSWQILEFEICGRGVREAFSSDEMRNEKIGHGKVVGLLNYASTADRK